MCIYVCIKVFSFCYSTELENITLTLTLHIEHQGFTLPNIPGYASSNKLAFLIFSQMKKQMLWAGNRKTF